MPKKFYDIIPPEEFTSLEDKKEKQVQPVLKKKRHLLKTLTLFILVLVLTGFIGSLFFSKVKVEIWPETEVLTFEQTITVNLQLEDVDFDNNIITGQIINDQKSGSQEFSASGKTLKEEKAKGIIKVYNAYSTSSRTLIPSRFVSSEGKLFWSTEKTTIPGARYEKGKLVPGEIDIEVEAAEPGEEYNIGPTTFALPALAGTALYTTIYARSFSPMSGGYEGEVAQVIQTDLDKAETVLFEKLKEESKESLRSRVSEDFILLDEAIFQKITEVKSSHKAGSVSELFNLEAKIESEWIMFKKSDVDIFVKNYINSNIKQGQKLQEESLSINYYLREIDLEFGRMVLDLEIKAKAYADIDLDKIKKALLGRSIKEARIFLENLPETTKIELKSWPFLKRRISEDMDKLEVKLKLD